MIHRQKSNERNLEFKLARLILKKLMSEYQFGNAYFGSHKWLCK